MSDADTLAHYGLKNTADIVAAAAQVGLPLWIAATFIQHESGGANVFGNDGGGAYSGGGTVTQAKYQDFLRLVRAGHTSNGVGPAQLTYPGYFKPVTAEVANLWQPRPNMVYGFKLIKASLGGNYSDASLNRAGQIYNSGRANGAPKYGEWTVNVAHQWKARLGSGTSTPVASTPDYTKDLTHWLTTTAQVKNFQTKVGTTADGIIGVNTIKAAQKKAGVTQDGVVGPNTVKGLQKAAGLTGSAVDGNLGPVTAAALIKWSTPAGTVAPTTTAFPLPKGHAYAMNDGTNFTHSGVNVADRPAIKKIQTKAGVKVVDGIYGALTKAAVIKAQKAKKITADGEVGPTTWKALAL